MQGKPKKHKDRKRTIQSDAADDALESRSDLELRATRESQGISIDEVAQKLHLSREVVFSLEEGDYEHLGAPVFVRGHLRNYARLLGLPEEALSVTLDESEPEPEEFRTLSAHKEVKLGASLPNFVLLMMLFAVVVGAAIYLMLGDADEGTNEFGGRDFATSNEQMTLSPDEAGQTQSVEQEQAEVAVPDASEPPVPADAATAAVVTTMEQVPSAPAASATVTAEPEMLLAGLIMRFNAECWVEVSDANAVCYMA